VCKSTSFSQAAYSKRVPLALRIDELPKRGCLRVSTAVVGFVLVRLGLTFSQAPTMLLHIEH
jgi:hypothetical protein